MSVYIYADGGERIQFDPQMAGAQLAGCILCGRPIAVVGIFVPATDEMRVAVLVLRRHAPRERSDAGLFYGLCRTCHARQDVTARVEAALVVAARRVTVQ